MLNAENRARGQRMPRSQRRAMLQEAALAVFVECGYHQAAMDDIAERAGVSKPVLYQHFPGKLDLYLAVLDEQCTHLEAAIAEALQSTDDNKRRVEATMRAYFTYVARRDGAFRLIFESDLADDPRVAARIHRLGHAAARGIAEIVSGDTGLGDEDALLLGMALTGMAQVSARHWIATRDATSLDEALEVVTSLAWRGVRGFPRTGAESSGRA